MHHHEESARITTAIVSCLAATRVVSTIPSNLLQGFEMRSGNEDGSEDETRAPSFFSVLGSVLASMFGVQSNRKREQDFTHGKPSQYIITGLLVTVVFVLTIWVLVSLVMKVAGV